MELFDVALYNYTRKPPDTSVVTANDSEQLKRCPLLLHIFHAFILGMGTKRIPVVLVAIRVLLEIPWDDLRVAMCRLRPIIGTDEAKIRALLRFVGEHHFSEPSIANLSSHLARGCIRLLIDVVAGRLPLRRGVYTNIRKLTLFIRQWSLPWGRFVRSSPHSAALLQDIREFTSFDSIHGLVGSNAFYSENYHNVLQWLKVGVKFRSESQNNLHSSGTRHSWTFRQIHK
jgi:hypothetical protein